MDTTMRIAILCDGDKCLGGSLLEDARRQVTTSELEIENAFYTWNEEMKIAVITIGNMFESALEQASEALIKMCEQINSVIEMTPNEKPKWYNPTDRNNYRKIHHVALRRVVRSRRGARESRRVIKGLTPGGIEIDEYAFAEED